MLENFINIISTYAQPIATVSGAIIIVLVTPLIGIHIYFRQKEYETIRQRYLDDGLAVIIRQVESSLDIYQHNWIHGITILKTFRDIGTYTSPESYIGGFIPIDNTFSIETSRHYLLIELTGDDIYYKAHQLLAVFLHTADNLFTVDLSSAIRLSASGKKEDVEIAPATEIFDTFFNELQKKQDESHKFFKYLGSLKKLESIYCKKPLNYKTIAKFKNNSDVIDLVSDMKNIFKDKLDKLST